MTAKLEHLNVTVRDPARTAAMMCDLFGWRIRWQGPSASGGATIHVGDEEAYVAVFSPNRTVEEGGNTGAIRGGLNHIGIVVSDLEAVERRVRKAGLHPFNHASYAPGRRFYFLDHDGIEFEVVSYERGAA
jgi:catechol 2,3-dioxygenase-like lactoylglutathione lyase family enzyme